MYNADKLSFLVDLDVFGCECWSGSNQGAGAHSRVAGVVSEKENEGGWESIELGVQAAADSVMAFWQK